MVVSERLEVGGCARIDRQEVIRHRGTIGTQYLAVHSVDANRRAVIKTRASKCTQPG